MNISERMNHFNVPGVSVSYFEKGKVKWNKCFGTMEKGTENPVTENSIFHACSISKMVTALCVLKLAQDKKLDLQKDVNEYLTSWKIGDNNFTETRKVTLANLLSHQGGLYDQEGSFPPYNSGDKVPTLIDLLTGETPYHSEEVTVKYTPETDCEYSDAGFVIVAKILEDVFGETVPRLAKRIVFDPLDLQNTFFWELGKDNFDRIASCVAGHDSNGDIVAQTRAGYPNIEGAALWTTPRELAHIANDIINAYQGRDSKILNHHMATFMLSPYGCADDVGMGVFLIRDSSGKPCFASQGWGVGMQCKLRAYYKDQWGVVVMINSEPGMEQDQSLVGEIIEYVCQNHKL